MATRIGLLHQGRLAQVGTPADLYERPISRYVATFMGNENVFPAHQTAPGQIEIDGIGLLAAPVSVPAAPFWIAIRPERLRLAETHPNAIVLTAAYFGDSAHYTLRLDAGATIRLIQPLGAGFGTGLLAADARTAVSLPPEALTILAE